MAVNTVHRADRDHRLYLWFAIFLPLTVLAGFARTYYLRTVFNGPAVPSLLVHVHGAVMTSWVLLFMAQVWLVASRRTRLHMRLGVAGAVLASLVVVIGMVTGIAAAARGASPGPPALQFLVIPFGDVLLFGVLVGVALCFRQRLDVHKRLMLIAAIHILTPAIARIPVGLIANGGPVAFFGLTDLCLLTCLAIDTIKNRKLHPAFLWGTIAVIAWQPLRILIAGTSTWNQFAAWLVSFAR